jgi:hypothetical protein
VRTKRIQRPVVATTLEFAGKICRAQLHQLP